MRPENTGKGFAAKNYFSGWVLPKQANRQVIWRAARCGDFVMKENTLPKEKVYDGTGLYDIQIAWGLDREVQLGVETHDGRSIAACLGADGTGVQALARFTGLWGTFDRRQLNRLIKMLRKARDEAYGRDE